MIKPTRKAAPPAERLPRPARNIPIFALSMDEAAAALGVSKPVVYGLVETGELRTFVIGKRRLATPRALAEATERLEATAARMPADTPHNRRAVATA